LAIEDADVVDRDDVGVAQASQGARLGQEPRAADRVNSIWANDL
jgi:hypothetical protein